MAAPSEYQPDLELALELADAVDELTLARFGAVDLAVTAKPDHTPVSDADRSAEALVRARLGAVRPGDAVLGEEFGADDIRRPSPPPGPGLTVGPDHIRRPSPSAPGPAVGAGDDSRAGGRRWVIDPIDGTKNYVRGVPVWATLIALLEGEQAVVGVASAPALGRRWWAAAGGGAWLRVFGGEPRRLSVSRVADLAAASISYSSLRGWAEVGRQQKFVDLLARVWRSRAYGDFWSYVLVAEGAVELAAEPQLSLWDMAALAPIVTEAGGRFTGLDGVDGVHSGNAAASNGLLHADLLDAIGDSSSTA